uniref:Carbonyl reductase 3 n=1 Tax=Saimiri boliviensis boliviensis TaxID=39432 RepID=A0A2K6SS95_SAIBB
MNLEPPTDPSRSDLASGKAHLPDHPAAHCPDPEGRSVGTGRVRELKRYEIFSTDCPSSEGRDPDRGPQGKIQLSFCFFLCLKDFDPIPFDVKAELTLKTNFFATRNVCNELLPLMKPHGRVVNISSLQCLRAFENCSEDLQEKFRSETLTEADLVDLMKKFVEDTKNEVHEREGWPNLPYGVSKLGVTVLSRILARHLDEKRKADRILMNACCPGRVKTDMNKEFGTRTVEEGAETPVYLALLPPDATEPQGQLLRDKVVQNW